MGCLLCFASKLYIFAKTADMVRAYNTKEEKIEAFKQAVALRGKWTQAIKAGASREQMESMGLVTPKVKTK